MSNRYLRSGKGQVNLVCIRVRPEFSLKINRYFKNLKLAVHEASFRREIMRKAAVPEAVRSTALISEM